MKTIISKTLMTLSMMAMTILLFTGCDPKEEPIEPTPTPTTVAVTGVSLSSSTLTLTEGDSGTLTAAVTPNNATNKTVNWSSSDSGVASVSDGKVTALKPGTTTIIASSADGGKTATCSVTVEAKKVPVTGVTLDHKEVELVEGEEVTLVAAVAPENATEKAVEWSTSSEEVVTVVDGKVTAVAPGTATITVKTKDGEKTASCAVTVTAKVIPVEGVELDQSELNLTVGDETVLTATLAPENASNKDVEWKSSNTKVATVVDGKVTAVAVGSVTITVKTKDGGKTSTCKVTVSVKTFPVEGITLSKDKLSLVEGEKVLLDFALTPENATNKAVTWSSSDKSVATVDTKGNVTGVKAGTATITVKTTDGGKTATCTVTVEKKTVAVTMVSLDKTTLSLEVGGESTLAATVSPSNATNKKLKWSSSNTAVATVDQNGKVKGIKAGSATITVTTEDGGKKATCAVTVKDKVVAVTGITLNKSTLSLFEAVSAQLTATISPSNATDKTVTWSSSNTSVATVDNTGKVTAVNAGTATITAKTSNNKSATCSVTVKARYTVKKGSMEMTENYSLTIDLGETVILMPFDLSSNAEVHAVLSSSSFSSTNSGVAEVSLYNAGGAGGIAAYNGWKIIGKSGGSSTVTMKYGNMTRRITVKVKEYTVWYSGKELTNPMHYTMVSKNEGILFQLYDKTSGSAVKITNDNRSYFTISSSDTSVASNEYGWNSNGKTIACVSEGTTTVTFKYKGVTIKTITLNLDHKYEVHFEGEKIGTSERFLWTAKNNPWIYFKLYDMVDKKYVAMAENNTPTDQCKKFRIQSSDSNYINAYNGYHSTAGKCAKAVDVGDAILTFVYNGETIASTQVHVAVKVALSLSKTSYTPIEKPASTQWRELTLKKGQTKSVYFWNMIQDKEFQMFPGGYKVAAKYETILKVEQKYNSSTNEAYFNLTGLKAGTSWVSVDCYYMYGFTDDDGINVIVQ